MTLEVAGVGEHLGRQMPLLHARLEPHRKPRAMEAGPGPSPLPPLLVGVGFAMAMITREPWQDAEPPPGLSFSIRVLRML